MAEQKAPIDAHAIDLITKLAEEASDVEMMTIETDHLSKGLPSVVPILLDRKAHGANLAAGERQGLIRLGCEADSARSGARGQSERGVRLRGEARGPDQCRGARQGCVGSMRRAGGVPAKTRLRRPQ